MGESSARDSILDDTEVDELQPRMDEDARPMGQRVAKKKNDV